MRTLTLISAPAGFGKTTLLSTTIRQQPADMRRVAWVSLDRRDNDPVRFWRYLVAALRGVDRPGAAHIGDTVLPLLRSPQPPPFEVVTTTLLNELVTVSGDVTLVLDDYHVIESRPIHDGLSYLLDHAPPNLHLVLATRTDPPLPLARWRAGGQLIEIHGADLRFTRDEVLAFLGGAMGLSLSGDQIAALELRTEGWIAGLHLLALSLRDRTDIAGFVAAFAGSHRYILDYLTEEVVQRQPEQVQRFLLETSILERLAGPLCDAVTGRGDGQALLLQLERANLFLVTLDEERRWYRYHHLFADALRHHLQQVQPDRIVGLRRRAATWLEGHGLIAEAVAQALAGEDWEHVACLVEEHAEALWLRGEVATLEGWIAALPEDVVGRRPRLCLVHGWMLFLTGHLEAIEPRLRQAEQVLRETQDVGQVPAAGEPIVAQAELRGMLATIRGSLASLQGNAPQAIAFAREALACLPEQSAHWRSQSSISLGIALDSAGDVAGAIQAFADAATISRRAGNTFQAIIALWSLAVRLISQGRLREAEETYRQALRYAGDRGAGRLPAVALAHLGLADLLRERNDLAAAEQHAREGLALGKQGGNFGALLSAHMSLARVLQARGTPDTALDALRPAEELVQNPDMLPFYAGWLAATRARLWLAQGNLPDALRWAQEFERAGTAGQAQLGAHVRNIALLTLVRVYIAQRDAVPRAQVLLEDILCRAESEGRTGVVIESLMLQARAVAAEGDTARALAILDQTLALAAPEGYVRLFVDEGAPMAALLAEGLKGEIREVADDPPAQHPEDLRRAYTRTLLAGFDTGSQAGASAQVSPWPQPDPQSPLPGVEPLSPRELEVLRLLAAGASNREICARLVISAGTVKAHLHSIYGKLEAHNRTEAAARARALGLV